MLAWIVAAFSKLKADKVFGLIFLGAVVGLLLWFGQTCGQKNVPLDTYNHAIAVRQDSINNLLAFNDSAMKAQFKTKHEADSLTQLAANVTAANDKLKIKVAAYKGKADSLFKVATNDSSVCVNLCDTWRATAIGYKFVVDSQAKIISQDDIRYAEQVEAYRRLGISYSTVVGLNDTLVAALKRPIPVYKEEKFLGFIPLPSRKTSLVVGLISGVVITSAAVVLAHH